MRRLGFLLFVLPSVASAQFSGAGQFPQFRNLSGLPGGLFGLRYDGRPSMDGAMAISTPLGYSLTDYHVAFGFAVVSRDTKPRLPTISEDTRNANGTLQGMIGIPLGRYGALTVAGMVHSRIGDSVLNLQYQIPTRTPGLGVSVGLQDVFSTGGSAGKDQPTDNDNSRSAFAAATYRFSPGVHATLGVGDTRFRGVFGNASANITGRLKAVVEYDTFNWNYGLSYNVGPLRKERSQFALDEYGDPRRGDVFLSLGFIDGDKIFYGVNLTF